MSDWEIIAMVANLVCSLPSKVATGRAADVEQAPQLPPWTADETAAFCTLNGTTHTLRTQYVEVSIAKGEIVDRVENRLTDEKSGSLKDWVMAIPKPHQIGYSTALMHRDIFRHKTLAREMVAEANSNGLELTLQDIRDAIRDHRQSQGKGKPGSGKRKLQLVPNSAQTPAASSSRAALLEDDEDHDLKVISSDDLELVEDQGDWVEDKHVWTKGALKILPCGGSRFWLCWGDCNVDAYDSVEEAKEAATKMPRWINGRAKEQTPRPKQTASQSPEGSPSTEATITIYSDCHYFKIDGNSLHCLDGNGQTVILVAPKGQRMTDILGALLSNGRNKIAKPPSDQPSEEQADSNAAATGSRLMLRGPNE